MHFSHILINNGCEKYMVYYVIKLKENLVVPKYLKIMVVLRLFEEEVWTAERICDQRLVMNKY
jgi:hypothetical protein